MPPHRILQKGFFGSSAIDVSLWCARHTTNLGAKNIALPFMGVGRHASAVCQEHTFIEMWETQELGALVIDLYQSKEVPSLGLTAPKFRKGIVYEERRPANIDDRCAGFIDYILAYGDVADKIAIIMSIPSNTQMGRMEYWVTDLPRLWEVFNERLKNIIQHIDMPGRFLLHKGDMFRPEVFPTNKQYDALLLDPPQLRGGVDWYSPKHSPHNFINRLLGGEANLPPWSPKEYKERIRRLVGINCNTILLRYGSGLWPSFEEILEIVQDTGEIVEHYTINQRRNIDHCVRIDKT